MTESETHWK